MFNHLEGIVSELYPDIAVIDCGGIGFEVTITSNTASALTLNNKAKLYISESVGEDHFDLFGFLSIQEKKFYKLLTGVSGIGPKAAMSILSYNSPDALTLAIINSDEKALTNCPGIGKKTAQRVILELKDKIAKQTESLNVKDIVPNSVFNTANNEYEIAVKGLNVLGYSSADISSVIKKINIENMKSDEIIRAVLKYMI